MIYQDYQYFQKIVLIFQEYIKEIIKHENYVDFIHPIIDIIKDDIYKKRNNGKYINGKYIFEDDKYYMVNLKIIFQMEKE